jgi:hypothetical protein
METDIEPKLRNALIFKLKQIREAKIDRTLETDIQILGVVLIQPVIVTPSYISKNDYTNAKEIQFIKGKIMLGKPDNNGIMENMYYFDWTATVNYLNNDFLINVTYITIYTN